MRNPVFQMSSAVCGSHVRLSRSFSRYIIASAHSQYIRNLFIGKQISPNCFPNHGAVSDFVFHLPPANLSLEVYNHLTARQIITSLAHSLHRRFSTLRYYTRSKCVSHSTRVLVRLVCRLNCFLKRHRLIKSI